MMLTLVPEAAPTFVVVLWLAFELHPVTTNAAAAAIAAAIIRLFLDTSTPLLGWVGGVDLSRTGGSQIRSGELGRPPAEEAVFQPGDDPFGRQGDEAHDDHGAPDAVGVEGALGVLDQHAEAL